MGTKNSQAKLLIFSPELFDSLKNVKKISSNPFNFSSVTIRTKQHMGKMQFAFQRKKTAKKPKYTKVGLKKNRQQIAGKSQLMQVNIKKCCLF